MDDIVRQAMAKWPNVPACYEWLSLDRRGNWRLQGERVSHPGLIAFLNQNYAVDDQGCWLVHNGPQRVFVDLAATPWIYRREGEGLLSHTGHASGAIQGIYLDGEGNLLIVAELGPGLLDDRDLAGVLAECTDSSGRAVDESAFIALLAGEPADVCWRGLPLQALADTGHAARFGFVACPRP